MSVVPYSNREIDLLLKSRSVYLGGGLLLLFVLQLLSGTDPLFAAFILLFGILTIMTVNALGGLKTLMGFSVCLLSLQHVLISQIAKVMYWQPADVWLKQPYVTGEIYVLGMASMWVAAMIWQKSGLPQCKPIFASETNPSLLFWTALICMVMEAGRIGLLMKMGVDSKSGQIQTGGIVGPLRQLNFLGTLAIASGTASQIIASSGRKSLGWVSVAAMGLLIIGGILNAKRELMVMAISTYYFTLFAFNFKLRFPHIASVGVMAYVAQFILFPYALIGRDIVRKPRFEDNLRLAIQLLGDVAVDPVKYQKLEFLKNTKVSTLHKRMLYYGHYSSTLDRFSVIIWCDALVDVTVKQGTSGMLTIQPGFDELLPRFIDPDKPTDNASNLLAHRLRGFVGDKNNFTGITLGFICDAFSSYGWLGVAIIPGLILFTLTAIYRLICDDRMVRNVLPLSLVFWFSYQFSENAISHAITTAFQGSVVMIVTLLFVRWVAGMLNIISLNSQHNKRRQIQATGATSRSDQGMFGRG
jgi:hypothetical protein